MSKNRTKWMMGIFTGLMMTVSSQAWALIGSGAEIKMANGARTSITQVRDGQSVAGFSEDSTVSHLVPEARKIDKVYNWGVSGNWMTTIHLDTSILEEARLTVSSKQIFVMSDGSLKKAMDIVEGDRLQKADGTTVGVWFKNEGFEYQKYLGVILDAPAASVNGHILVANGLLVGDMVLSGDLQ